MKELYPNIDFTIGLANGLQEEIFLEKTILLNNLDNIEEGYDLTALIHFPVEVPNMTKSEHCCIEEIGIEPIWGHKPLPKYPSKLVAVHYNLTSIPELVKPTEEVAKKIWDEIIKEGFIPIECHFPHVFDNPENKMFSFIDCTVRGCRAEMTSLLGLINSCAAFVGVVSGPFHVAMCTMPHEKICYLEKELPISRFTKENIKSVDIKNYKDGQVGEWLKNITS